MREVVGATLGSLGFVLGAEYLVAVHVIGAMVGSLHVVLDGCAFGCCFGCCTGGAWCHHSNCFGHSLTPWTQTCAKGKWLGKKSRDNECEMNLGFWCAIWGLCCWCNFKLSLIVYKSSILRKVLGLIPFIVISQE